MKTFARSDARELNVVPGFRDWLLSYRASVTPKASWSDTDYAAAADKKRRRLERLARSLQSFHGSLRGTRLLDVGCGDGVNCLLLASDYGVAPAVGIDLHLTSFGEDEPAERCQRLIKALLRNKHKRPARFAQMDATRMGFGNETFDVVISRSAMEHIRPIPGVLGEILRVTRPGGLIYLGIDPFFWLRGCHKRGVVDIPWAHARMPSDDFERFVCQTEGEQIGAKRRQRLETLNRLTVAEWREVIDGLKCEVLDWRTKHSETGEQLLQQHPDVIETLLPNVQRIDLLTERIEVWLRKP